MPRYLYECENGRCIYHGDGFEEFQSMADDPLRTCPACGAGVSRVIRPVGLSMPRGDVALKEQGFAKLVRRDRGVYENVTALGNESRYYHADRPETMPDLKRRITD